LTLVRYLYLRRLRLRRRREWRGRGGRRANQVWRLRGRARTGRVRLLVALVDRHHDVTLLAKRKSNTVAPRRHGLALGRGRLRLARWKPLRHAIASGLSRTRSLTRDRKQIISVLFLRTSVNQRRCPAIALGNPTFSAKPRRAIMPRADNRWAYRYTGTSSTRQRRSRQP